MGKSETDRTRCVICGRFMSNDVSNAFVLMQPGRAGLVCCFGNTAREDPGYWLVVTDRRDVFLERLRPVWIQGVGA